GDGGVVALWYYAPEPAVVEIGSEGESEVLARNFEEFVQAVNAKKCGLIDLDREDEPFTVPGVVAKAPVQDVALQRRFDEWFDAHQPQPDLRTDAELQPLLNRICNGARQMVDDGCVDQ